MTRPSRLIPLALLAAATVVGSPRPGLGQEVTWRIVSESSDGYRVRVTFPPPTLATGRVFGSTLTEISMPGAMAEAPPGSPQLPVVAIPLRIPWGVEPRVEARAGASRSLGLHRPVPLPGLIASPEMWKDLSAADVSRHLEGPAYTSPRAPGGPLQSAIPMAAGDRRVVQARLCPFAWDPRHGELTVIEEATLDVTWERAPSPPETYRRSRGALGRAAGLGAAYSGPLRVGPGRPWVRLGVLRPGLYAVSPADLAAAGVSTAAIDPSTFRLFRATPADLPESVSVLAAPDSLRECAIAVTGEGDGTLDPGDRVYFYATGRTGFGYDLAHGGTASYREAQRSDEEALWLTWGPGPNAAPPRRIPARDAAPATPAPLLTEVPHRVHYEQNRFRDFDRIYPGFRWERWFFRLFNQGSRIAFPINLPGASTGGAASLLVRMWGRTVPIGATVADHYVNLYWNKAPAASAAWNFLDPRDITASGITVKAADTLEVEVPRVTDPLDPSRLDQSLLAWFEVTYPRRLVAVNDTLQFSADSSQAGPVHYSLSGVTDTTAAWLLDRTDPESPVRLVGGAFVGAAAPFTLTVEDSVGAGYVPRYALVSTARAARPASIARYAPLSSAHSVADLLDPANGADYLIVAPPAFLAAAETLATFRSGRLHGFASPRVAIATTDRVFAQLAGGATDHTAIRNLLAYARTEWTGPAPSFVCLLGDASLDPKNHEGFAVSDWVPVYSNYYDVFILKQHISDDWYGFLDGPSDVLLDVAIGRLPARTALEALDLVRGKLRAFEASAELDPWRIKALLSADDSWKRERRDGLGNVHVEEMERKDRQHLPVPVERSKVYLNDFAFADTSHQTKPAAREEFIARINEGNWLVDYAGHGSDFVLADEQLFRATDAGRLTNASRPSIFAFMSCTVGKFDELGQEGLGELVLKHSAGGAVASLAATERVFPEPSTKFNDSFVDSLFPADPRVDSVVAIGRAWMAAKNVNANNVVLKYVLLGDPASTPPTPRGRGAWLKAPQDSILRGDLAALQGRALNGDGTPDTLSSGVALVEVRGKLFERIQTGLNTFGVLVPTTYTFPGPILYRGSVAMDRGAFEARFVVPQDGRIAGGVGRLQALLSEAGGLGVGLAVDSIHVGQGVSPRVDQTPPTISLRYPSGSDSTVQPGDRLGIVIEDSSGVDLMRLDNAHTIFAILDDRGSPTEITESFAYDPGSYTRGAAEYPVPSLPEGLHRLEVHASDTFGNIAIRTFVLDVHPPVAPGDPVMLTQVFNYPNPFAGTTYLHARLNQAARIRAQILTVSGRRVREISVDGKAGENYIPWDGKDSMGENVAIGVYLFKITAESAAGKRASAIGKALRTE